MNGHRVAWACAAVVAVSVQAASNALFAYELADGMAPVAIGGAKLSAIGLGFASMAVVIAVSQAMAAAEFFRPGGTKWLAACIALPCMVASIASVVSHVLAFQQARLERGAAADAAFASARNIRDARKTERDDAVKAHARAEAELAKRPPGRGISEIEADLAAVRVAPDAWRASNQCTRIADRWTGSACEPVLNLRAEKAAAVERYGLATAVQAEADKVASAYKALEEAERDLGRAPKPETPWPVRVFLAQMLPWVLAVVVELCGTLGFVMAERAKPRPAPRAPAPSAPTTPTNPAPPSPVARHATDLGVLLQNIATGKTTAAGVTITADGWIDASQAALGRVLGVTAPTISRQLGALESNGVIETRKQGNRSQVRIA